MREAPGTGLERKVVVIVGGESPLAAAVEEALVAAGASATRLAPPATAAAARAALAGVDGLAALVVVPAFATPPAAATDADEDDWDAAVEVEARRLWLAAKEGGLAMSAGGRGALVVLVPEVALAGVRGTAVVAAAAGALLAATRALSVDLAPAVRINVVAYGCIEGDPYGDWFARADPQRTAALEGSQTLLGRNGEPAEVARAAAFLASDRASFVHGHTLVVDGGYLVR